MSETTLAERVIQFNTLRLPGQPLGMHMGTSYLVNDLWCSHQNLVAALEAMLVNPDKASRKQARAALNRANNR